jgi:hypothetical protein
MCAGVLWCWGCRLKALIWTMRCRHCQVCDSGLAGLQVHCCRCEGLEALKVFGVAEDFLLGLLPQGTCMEPVLPALSSGVAKAAVLELYGMCCAGAAASGHRHGQCAACTDRVCGGGLAGLLIRR